MIRRLSLGALTWLSACTPAPTVSPEPTAPEFSILRVEYRGEIQLEAHLERPGDTTALLLAWAQTCDEAGHCLVEQTVGPGGDAPPQRIWSTPEASWADGASSRLPEADAAALRRLIGLFGPREVDPPQLVLRYAHHRLGTTTETARYSEWGGEDGRRIPGSIQLDHYEADVAFEGTFTLESSADAEAPALPEAPPATSFPAPSIVRLDDGLWDVRIPEHDARSLVVELDSSVVVFEAPWSSEDGERVVDLVTEALPDKPIRYVLYSHHHPHYTGGLRAFMAAGVTIVAPASHAEFVSSIAERTFDLEPDRQQTSGLEPRIETFERSFVIEDGRRLEIYDIGPHSHHTAAYMIAWLPRENVLIEGDIGWFVRPDGDLAVGQRSAGLLEAIDELELPVQTLLQTWPVNSQEPTLEMTAFRAAVAARK